MAQVYEVLELEDIRGKGIKKYRLTERTCSGRSNPRGMCDHKHKTPKQASACKDARKFVPRLQDRDFPLTEWPLRIAEDRGMSESKILHLMVGLPRSGKTSFAMCLANITRAAIVNPDSIRLELHGQAFHGPAEKFVWAQAELMVRSLFRAGHMDVIIDATNTTLDRRKAWKSYSREWIRRYHVLDTTAEECVRRADETDRQDLIPVIARMSENYERIQIGELDEDKQFRIYNPELLSKTS